MGEAGPSSHHDGEVDWHLGRGYMRERRARQFVVCCLTLVWLHPPYMSLHRDTSLIRNRTLYPPRVVGTCASEGRGSRGRGASRGGHSPGPARPVNHIDARPVHRIVARPVHLITTMVYLPRVGGTFASEGRGRSTLSWREAGPPNHHDSLPF